MTPRIPYLLLALGAGLALTTGTAHAAKQWDPYTAINFTVTGSDAEMAPSAEGDNGLQTTPFNVTTYNDTDHWIDPAESAPNNEGYPYENLPFGDITFSSDADPYFSVNADDPYLALGWYAGLALQFNGSPTDTTAAKSNSVLEDDFTFAAPDQDGDFGIYFTGTDRDQTIGPGESGSRNDPDNTSQWWNMDPGV